MKIINPKTIKNSMMQYSNIPEIQSPTSGFTEPAEYVSTTGYTTGQQVSVVLGTNTASITHGVYESTLETTNTGNDPTIKEDNTNWKFIRSTIRWAMFNEILQDQTVINNSRQNGLTLAGGSGNYASSPDASFPTDRFTLYARIKPTDSTPASDMTIFSKYNISENQKTVALKLTTTGRIELIVSGNGSAEISYVSSEVSQMTNSTSGWIKIVFDGNNGLESSAEFYDSLEEYGSEDLISWSKIGETITGIQTAIFNSSSVFELGSINAGTAGIFVGSIQQLVVYDGILEEGRKLSCDYNRIDAVSGGTSTSWRTGQVWTDNGTSSFSQDLSGIVSEIKIGVISNSIALMNLSATTVQIIGRDSLEGEIYNRSFNLQSANGIGGMYSWLFDPLTFDINLVLFDLPAYAGAEFRVIISAPNTAKCGAVVLGNEFEIGASQYGAKYGIENYSTKSIDAKTGAVTVSAGTFRSISDVEVKLLSARFTSVLNTLTDLRNRPVVWVGSDFVSGMIQYGYYKSFSEIYSNYSQATCLLEIEGLS